MKREAVKLRRAKDQKQAEVEKNSSSTGDDDAADWRSSRRRNNVLHNTFTRSTLLTKIRFLLISKSLSGKLGRYECMYILMLICSIKYYVYNKTTGTYLRLSQVAFDNRRMKTVHSILRLEKMVETSGGLHFSCLIYDCVLPHKWFDYSKLWCSSAMIFLVNN